jgi:hypothetical protein
MRRSFSRFVGHFWGTPDVTGKSSVITTDNSINLQPPPAHIPVEFWEDIYGWNGPEAWGVPTTGDTETYIPGRVLRRGGAGSVYSPPAFAIADNAYIPAVFIGNAM